MAVEILEHAVVGQDVHLVVREDHGEETRAAARAAAALVDAAGRRTAVMAVGDVERGHFRELADEEIDVRCFRNRPRAVAHAVRRGEVDLRLAGGDAGNERVDFRHGLVGEENRAGLRVERLDVTDAVVLLVRAGEFVLFDDVFQILLATRQADESDLAVAAHHLPVEMEHRRGITPQHAIGDEFLEILTALRIDGVRIQDRCPRADRFPVS